MYLKQSEVTEAKSSIEEPPELELKDLPSHLEYAYLEENNKLPVIIAKGLNDNEKDALLKVLKSHKRAIAWKITNIKGIDPRFCTQKILMEDDYKPTVQGQRRVNPKIHEERIEKTKRSKNDQKPTRNGKKTKSQEQDKEISQKSQPDQQKRQSKEAQNEVKGPRMTSLQSLKGLFEVGFYRRFIQDFSKIARPMTHLLEKETPFLFSKDCIDALKTLKKKLTETPIFVVPDWNLPFELMCDASDFAIGAVLGQRRSKHFQPIHYASKTMTEAQIHYTTT
ncbi:reverse transcriptase domain-containing protein [Tanacetum coccineum]